MLKKLGILMLALMLVMVSLPTDAFARTIEVPRPVSLDVRPSSMTLEPGQSESFEATLTFSDGKVKDVTRNAVIIVSNARVVKAGGGKVTAVAPGSASITIKSYGKTAVINVNVKGMPVKVEKPEPAPADAGLAVVPPEALAQKEQPKTVPVVTRPEPQETAVSITGPKVIRSDSKRDEAQGDIPVVFKPQAEPEIKPVVDNRNSTVPRPVSLDINPTNVILQPGQSETFRASITFSDDSTRDVTTNAVFVISNRNVVTIGGGKITALAPGSATITMRSYGLSGTINVTVKKPEAPKPEIPRPVNLTVNPDNVTLEPGQSREFKAMLTFSDGSIKDVTRDAVFIVSNIKVVTIGNGFIKALSPGTATITMQTYGLVKTINVTVTQPKTFTIPKPVKLEVTPNAVTLQPGQSQEFHAAISFSDGSVRDVTQNAVFIVNNRNVATVGNGKIVALGPGNATITMQSYGLTARIDVTVQEAKIQVPKPVKIVVPQSLTLKAGETEQVKATLTFTDGSSKDITSEAVWTTSNSEVATVSGGKITALAPGTAIITVNSNGITASIVVNVAAEEKPPVTKTIKWQYNNKTFEEDLEVPADLLAWDKNVNEIATRFYKSDPWTQQKMLTTMPQDVKELVLALSSSNKGNVSPWVKEPQNIAYISTLARSLQEKAQKEGYDRFQTAEFILSFVQAIPYVQHDILQLPAQTLIESGDCDDKTVLLGAILRSLGYEVALLHYSANTHMNLGVAFDKNEVPQRGYAIRYYEYQGKRYYIAETTSHDPRIGVGPFWRMTEIFPVK